MEAHSLNLQGWFLKEVWEMIMLQGIDGTYHGWEGWQGVAQDFRAVPLLAVKTRIWVQGAEAAIPSQRPV